jgi:hypothetical protein
VHAIGELKPGKPLYKITCAGKYDFGVQVGGYLAVKLYGCLDGGNGSLSVVA